MYQSVTHYLPPFMKKAILTAVCLMTLVFSANAQYQKLGVFEMALSADLIVSGTIKEVKPLTFTVEVANRYYGDATEGVIEVSKFKGAKNAKRWGKYLEGEQVLLFLVKGGGAWDLMGEGGEGEKLILNDEVYLDNRGGAIFSKYNYIALPTGTNIYAEKLPIGDFTDAVKGLRDLFSLEYITETNVALENSQKPVVKQTGKDEMVDTYRGKSDIHNKLADDCVKAFPEEK